MGSIRTGWIPRRMYFGAGLRCLPETRFLPGLLYLSCFLQLYPVPPAGPRENLCFKSLLAKSSAASILLGHLLINELLLKHKFSLRQLAVQTDGHIENPGPPACRPARMYYNTTGEQLAPLRIPAPQPAGPPARTRAGGRTWDPSVLDGSHEGCILARG